MQKRLFFVDDSAMERKAVSIALYHGCDDIAEAVGGLDALAALSDLFATDHCFLNKGNTASPLAH